MTNEAPTRLATAAAKPARTTFLLCLIPLLAALTVFTQTVRFDYISLDDPHFVFKNPYVKQGFTSESIQWAFGFKNQAHDSYNYPLSWLSFILEYQLFGDNPGALHFIGTLIHALTSSLVMFWLLKLSGRLWPSLLAGLIFAIHPLQVESVAWISQRNTQLAGCFFFFTLITYHFYALGRGRAYYFLTLILLTLSMMGKQFALGTPLLLLLLDVFIYQRFTLESLKKPFSKPIIEKIPFALIIILFAIWGLIGQDDSKAVRNDSIGTRLINVLWVYGTQIRHFLLPLDIPVIYQAKERTFSAIIPGLLLVSGISALIWRFKNKWATLGWLWFITLLLPISGIIPIGKQATANRYMYLPISGLLILALFSTQWENSKRRRIILSGLLVLIFILGGVSIRDSSPFYNIESFAQASLKDEPEQIAMRENLVAVLMDEARYKEAIAHIDIWIKNDPKNPEAYLSLGQVNIESGDLDAAIEIYQHMIEKDIGPDKAMLNLAFCHVNKKQPQMAENTLRKLIEKFPNHESARIRYAQLLEMRGAIQEAIQQLDYASQTHPDGNVYYQLIRLNLKIKNLNRASHLLELARKKFPQHEGLMRMATHLQ